MRIGFPFVLLVIAALGCHRIDEVTPHNLPAPSEHSDTVPGPTHQVLPSDSSPQVAAPDNTATNQRDRDSEFKTPFDQGENRRDLSISADIRKRLVDAQGISVNGRNIKVITAEGKVTLRGPVASEEERRSIAAIATEVAGEGNVQNQLEVASTSSQP